MLLLITLASEIIGGCGYKTVGVVNSDFFPPGRTLGMTIWLNAAKVVYLKIWATLRKSDINLYCG